MGDRLPPLCDRMARCLTTRQSPVGSDRSVFRTNCPRGASGSGRTAHEARPPASARPNVRCSARMAHEDRGGPVRQPSGRSNVRCSARMARETRLPPACRPPGCPNVRCSERLAPEAVTAAPEAGSEAPRPTSARPNVRCSERTTREARLPPLRQSPGRPNVRCFGRAASEARPLSGARGTLRGAAPIIRIDVPPVLLHLHPA